MALAKFNVAKCDKNGKVIEIYETAYQAAKLNGLKNSGIYACLSGKGKTTGGFSWMIVPPCGDRRKTLREDKKRDMYAGTDEIKEIIEKIISKKQEGRIPCGTDREATFIKTILDKKGISNYLFVNIHRDLFIKFDLLA